MELPHYEILYHMACAWWPPVMLPTEKYRHCPCAQSFIDSGDFAAAESAIETAVASWPDNPRFHLAMAECISIHRQDPERALPW